MSGDRISLKELRAEVASTRLDGIEVWPPTLLALVEAVEAAGRFRVPVTAPGGWPSAANGSPAAERLDDALARFKDYAGEAD